MWGRSVQKVSEPFVLCWNDIDLRCLKKSLLVKLSCTRTLCGRIDSWTFEHRSEMVLVLGGLFPRLTTISWSKFELNIAGSDRWMWNMNRVELYLFNGTVKHVSCSSKIHSCRCCMASRSSIFLPSVKNFFLQANDKDNILKNIVMGDRTLIYAYDIETKSRSLQWTLKSALIPKSTPCLRER
jgi:hypothetical protein